MLLARKLECNAIYKNLVNMTNPEILNYYCTKISINFFFLMRITSRQARIIANN